MRSMTGFGRASYQGEEGQVTVTLRTVNHRHLDLSFRGRDELRELEPTVRQVVAKDLRRGRVEIQIEATSALGEGIQAQVDEGLLEALGTLGADLESRGLLASSRLELTDLLRLPNLLRLESKAESSWLEEGRGLVLGVVEEALTQLVSARETEGAKLLEILSRRLEELQRLHGQMREQQEGVGETLLANLRGRIEELLRDLEVVTDEGRLAQEAALLVDRLDISEELDRLESHIDHFSTILQAEGSIGKRLDFLTQEIFRELNTIGSKCRDSDLIRLVLDGKVICEQLREQIQNVE